MSIDIDKLEALARAATPGPWSMAEDGSPVVNAGGRAAHLIGPPGSDEEAVANTQFIAAVDPVAILSLIARLREAEAREQALAAHLDRFMDVTSEEALADDDWVYGLDEVRNSAPIASLARRDVSPGVAAIAAERRRQVEAEGWSPEHDDEHDNGELVRAAAAYASHSVFCDPGCRVAIPALWPWDRFQWKPSTARRNLERAGALIAAEIDRLDRAEQADTAGEAP